MTKKHFIALAAEMQAIKPSPFFRTHRGVDMPNSTRLDQWLQGVNALASVCAQFSPRFDRARFLVACGVSDDTAACGVEEN